LEQIQEGTAQIQDGITKSQLMGVQCYLPVSLHSLSKAQALAGHPEKSLTTLTRAIALADQKDEGHWKAELYRLWADLLLSQGVVGEAEIHYQESITIARHQQAKSWELRAAISLAHLWQKQGKLREVRQLLEPIYNWFTEGFDTPDLKEARVLLEECS
ncbi:MAG: hypothetical protein IH629_07615, partial [Thermoleophilia bacterium]|nr:hypothetical protein [Thermoleophilia bacterium]